MLPKRRNPTHPGEVLHEEFLKPQNISIKKFAQMLGHPWSEEKITLIIKGKEHLSPELIEKLGALFNIESHFWVHLQSLYHEWESIHRYNEKGSLKPWKKAQ